MYKRKITNIIHRRLLEKRQFIQVVFGPRQVGKTTAIHQILQDMPFLHHYGAADLPAPPNTQWITQQWDMARLKIKGDDPVVLVLDEVQKIERWSIEVKRLWDEDSQKGHNIYVVLLGSSALLLQKGLDESLAGRFELSRFPHWSWEECRDCFGWFLDQYVYFGGYPGAALLIDDEWRWRQYVQDSLIETAISRDVLLLSRVEKPALLRQLFVLSCEYGGQILSYQKILGQLADRGNTTTIAHYQRLLENAFLIRGVPKWAGKAIRRRNSSPKWVPLNTALMTAIFNRSFKEVREDTEVWGRLVEVAVGSYLINHGASYGIETFYWRQSPMEVDFVLRKGNKIVAIEVKSGKKYKPISGIIAFAKMFDVHKSIIVGPTGIELQNFLETPILKWFDYK